MHIEVINNVIASAETLGLQTKKLAYSPIKGPAGNIEYLVYLSNDEKEKQIFSVEQIVEEATNDLN